jgi:hypothetical protein
MPVAIQLPDELLSLRSEAAKDILTGLHITETEKSPVVGWVIFPIPPFCMPPHWNVVFQWGMWALRLAAKREGPRAYTDV